MAKRGRRGRNSPGTRLGDEVEEVVDDIGENLGRRGRRRDRDNDNDTPPTDPPRDADAPDGPVQLTKAGQRKIGNLGEHKDTPTADAIRARGGGQAQVGMVDPAYQNMTVGEIANRAAAGDAKAETAMKMIKQASSKAQKYGRGGH